ncbi:hypothetical protein BJ742DRAFT_852463 [Cladochytrium replicatum]|nr:hypothetical protein BJ742DRAFT_852463 [Cladochytrium replicatum]
MNPLSVALSNPHNPRISYELHLGAPVLNFEASSAPPQTDDDDLTPRVSAVAGLSSDGDLGKVEKPRASVQADKPKRKIVVAMDGERKAMDGFLWTLDNVARPGDEIIGLKVVRIDDASKFKIRPEFSQPKVLTTDLSHLANELLHEYQAAAEEHQPKLAKQLQYRIDVHLGQPKEIICSMAKNKKANLIVLVSREKSITNRMLVGSVSDFVTQHSGGIPVLVVKPTH